MADPRPAVRDHPRLLPTRRAVLASAMATVAAGIAGCATRSGRRAEAGAPSAGAAGSVAPSAPASSGAATPSATASAEPGASAPPASSLAAWATAVGTAEADLIAGYDAAVKAHPALKRSLTTLRAAHAAHLQAVAPGLSGKAAGPPGATSVQALTRLAAAELTASDLAGVHCVSGPAEAAALLGSIAAGDASHVLLLKSLGAS